MLAATDLATTLLWWPLWPSTPAHRQVIGPHYSLVAAHQRRERSQVGARGADLVIRDWHLPPSTPSPGRHSRTLTTSFLGP